MNTRIKICGITRPQDALAAADLGADAIGLVFFSGSKRAVDVSGGVESAPGIKDAAKMAAFIRQARGG